VPTAATRGRVRVPGPPARRQRARGGPPTRGRFRAVAQILDPVEIPPGGPTPNIAGRREQTGHADIRTCGSSRVTHCPRGVGDQRPQTRPRHPAAPARTVRGEGTTPAAELRQRAGARRTAHPGLRGGRRRRRGRPAHRRRLVDHAATSVGVPGTRAGGPVPRSHRLPAGPHLPAGRDPGQPPAGVRCLRPRPPRHGPARDRAAGAHPRGRPDPRDDALRQQRAVPLRAPPTLPD